MTRTANATYPMKITCLIGLAAAGGHPFICPECGRPILADHIVQFDHRQAVGRGGANKPEDLAPVHSAKRGTVDPEGHPLDCHDRKTFRPRGGATTLGGDNYEAKKTDRLGEKHAVNKPPTGTERPERHSRAWAKRPMQTARRPWPKRKMRGRA